MMHLNLDDASVFMYSKEPSKMSNRETGAGGQDDKPSSVTVEERDSDKPPSRDVM